MQLWKAGSVIMTRYEYYLNFVLKHWKLKENLVLVHCQENKMKFLNNGFSYFIISP